MQPWTTRYARWTGSFADLVATANTILQSDYPGSEAVTERTARHYQQIGVLGKGSKTGRTAQFTAEDLAALVNAKALAKDVGLKMVSALSQTYAPSDVSAYHLSATHTLGQASGEVAGAPANAAMAAVAQLMNQAEAVGSVTSSTVSAGLARSALALNGSRVKAAIAAQIAQTPVALAHAMPPSVPTLFAHHSPTPWLTVALDESAAQAAPAPDRARAAALLTQLAARLTQE